MAANDRTAATWRKMLAAVGLSGCVSCFIAMAPLTFAAIAGLIGISAGAIIFALSAYAASTFFVPVLAVSIALSIVGMVSAGPAALVLSILAGAAIFVSMTFYLRSWLFFAGLLLLGAAHIFGLSRRGAPLTAKNIIAAAWPYAAVAATLAILTYSIPSAQRQTSLPPPTSPPDPCLPECG